MIKQHLGYFPWIQLEATVSPITRTVLKVRIRAFCHYSHLTHVNVCTTGTKFFLLFIIYCMITALSLQVDLHITPEFTWKDRFHGTSQRWWILVEVDY